MISVIHAPADERVDTGDDFPIPAAGRRIEMDWDSVARAFEAASEQFAWDAHVRVYPERRLVELVVPGERTDQVAGTTLPYYAAVAERIGIDAFASIWVDFDVAR